MNMYSEHVNKALEHVKLQQIQQTGDLLIEGNSCHYLQTGFREYRLSSSSSSLWSSEQMESRPITFPTSPATEYLSLLGKTKYPLQFGEDWNPAGPTCALYNP
jgi:hypothetical protein